MQNSNASISGNILKNIQQSGIITNNSTAYVIRNLLINCGTAGSDYRAIDCDSSFSRSFIINNTIVNCTNGIVCYNSAAPTIRNNIIVNNTHNGIYCFSGGNPTLLFNCVWNNGTNYNGCIPGSNDISADPLFTTGPGGECYLSHVAAGQSINSPCIDAGDTTAEALNLDIYTTRSDTIHDEGIVDLGYHYDIKAVFGISERNSIVPANLLLQVYPNPSFGYIFLKMSGEYHQFGDETKIIIYNCGGIVVKEINIGKYFSGLKKIELGNLPSGIYFYTIKQNGEHFSHAKIVLIR